MPEARWESTLRPPDARLDLSGFPSASQAKGTRSYRVHAAEHSPWFFSAHAGRFNLRAPRGTLNTASSADAAVREFLGRLAVGRRGSVHIPSTAVRGKAVTALAMERPRRLADSTSPRAASYGVVPGDMSAPQQDGYDTTRAWAAALDGARNARGTALFDGIRCPSRFIGRQQCLYFFGAGGERAEGTVPEASTPLGRYIRSQMTWITLDPVPHSHTLVIDP